ncbi:MAG: hypothetical protein ACYSUI_02660 [Planctomycetota bacterium]
MLTISEATTVRGLLSVHPQAFEVLLRHGMCADCQADPPPVPLGHFASKHCGGDFVGLSQELRHVIGGAIGGSGP